MTNRIHPDAELAAARKQNKQYKNTIANFVSVLRVYVACMIIFIPIALSHSKNNTKTAKQTQSIVKK